MQDRERRQIRPVGMTEGKLRALEDLRKLKASGGKRSEQFKVSHTSYHVLKAGR